MIPRPWKLRKRKKPQRGDWTAALQITKGKKGLKYELR